MKDCYLFLGRAIHSSSIKEGYKGYFIDEKIIDPLGGVFPLAINFQNHSRIQLINLVKADLEKTYSIKIGYLTVDKISKLDHPVEVVLGIGECDKAFKQIKNVRAIHRPDIPGKICKTFKAYEQSISGVKWSYYPCKTDTEKRLEDRLKNFINNPKGYGKARSGLNPEGGNSLLSAYLAIGALRVENLFYIIENHKGKDQDLEEFRRQCRWILYSRRRYEELVDWPLPELTPEQREKLSFWIEGNIPATYPHHDFINTYMKALKEGLPVSNRFRLITSYYLLRVLKVPWIWGERYFRAALTDYEPGANLFNWYWQSERNRFVHNYNLTRQIGDYGLERKSA